MVLVLSSKYCCSCRAGGKSRLSESLGCKNHASTPCEHARWLAAHASFRQRLGKSSTVDCGASLATPGCHVRPENLSEHPPGPPHSCCARYPYSPRRPASKTSQKMRSNFGSFKAVLTSARRALASIHEVSSMAMYGVLLRLKS